MLYNITDEDFQMLENPASEFYSIKLNKGKWKDVIFTYGAVSIKEDKKNDTATLSFNWNLSDPADHEPEDLKKNEDFNNYLGSLLQYIIDDSLNKEAKIGTANAHIKSSST